MKLKACLLISIITEEYSTASDVYAFCVSLNELLAETPPVMTAASGVPLFCSINEQDPILSELLFLVQNGMKVRRLRPSFDGIAESLCYLHSEAKQKFDVSNASSNSGSSKVSSQGSLFVDLTCKQVCSLLEFCDLHHLIVYITESGLTGGFPSAFIIFCIMALVHRSIPSGRLSCSFIGRQYQSDEIRVRCCL